MRRGVLIRLLLCIFFAAFLLYLYIDRLNDITQLKMEIPVISREVRILREENDVLKLQIEQIERPSRLIGLLRDSNFSHLKQPSSTDVIIIEEE